MDNNLNILETKVLEAVELIKELRVENQRLASRNSEFEGQATALEAQIEGLVEQNRNLSHELAEARQQAGIVEVYEEKRKEIEDKVGGLLAKLEALG